MRVPLRNPVLARVRRLSSLTPGLSSCALDPLGRRPATLRCLASFSSRVLAVASGHGDPVPLPTGFDGRSFEKVAGMPRYLVRRRRRVAGRERCVEEAAATLNRFASTSGNGQRPSLPHLLRLTDSQQNVLARIGRRVALFGDTPDYAGHGALFEFLRSPDFYGTDARLREPLDAASGA